MQACSKEFLCEEGATQINAEEDGVFECEMCLGTPPQVCMLLFHFEKETPKDFTSWVPKLESLMLFANL